MEYKNINGLSISEIEKEVGKGVQLVIVGSGSETGKMSSALAKMMASEHYACICLETLSKTEQDTISAKMILDEIKPNGSAESMMNELIKGIRKTALELKAYEPEISIEMNNRPWEVSKKNRKLKGYQKKR